MNPSERSDKDTIRTWIIRLLFTVAGIAGALRLLSHTSESPDILGRYSIRLFGLFSLLGAAHLAFLVMSFVLPFDRFVTQRQDRLKLSILALAVPSAVVILLLGDQLTDFGALWWQAFILWLLPIFVGVVFLAWDALVVRPVEVLLTVLSLVVSFVLAESIAKAWFIQNGTQAERATYFPGMLTDSRFTNHPYLNYMLRPGYIDQESNERINSLGYRGEEIVSPKPEGSFRIVAIGGSTTYGWGNAWYDSYPAQLQDVLREEYQLPNIEVINAGVPDYTTWESLINLEFRVLDLEPDLVLVYHTVNDVNARLVPPEHYQGDASGYRRQWDRSVNYPRVSSVLLRLIMAKMDLIEPLSVSQMTKVYSEGAVEGYNDYLGMTALEALQANPPVYYERNLRSMVAITRAHAVDIAFIAWAYNTAGENADYYLAGYAQHANVMEQVAEQLEVPLIPFDEEMETDDAGMWNDSVHTSPQGSREMAEIIARFLVEWEMVPLD